MAKRKTPNINGYGLKSPWAFEPSDANQRAEYTAGAGTYQGRGIKNPMGRNRSSSLGNVTPANKLKKPPKSLA